MTENTGLPILLVSPDAERRDRAAAALQGLGEVLHANDMSGALDELSLGQPMIVVIDGALPADRIAGILDASGDPDRAVLWVSKIELALLDYGAFIQIPYEAGDQVLAAAVTRLAELLHIKRQIKEQRERVGRFDHLVDVVRNVQYEINNPLTSLLAEAQLLLLDADRLSEQQRAGLRTIEAMAERIRDVVRRLHELTTGT